MHTDSVPQVLSVIATSRRSKLDKLVHFRIYYSIHSCRHIGTLITDRCINLGPKSLVSGLSRESFKVCMDSLVGSGLPGGPCKVIRIHLQGRQVLQSLRRNIYWHSYDYFLYKNIKELGFPSFYEHLSRHHSPPLFHSLYRFQFT